MVTVASCKSYNIEQRNDNEIYRAQPLQKPAVFIIADNVTIEENHLIYLFSASIRQ